ncbi:hypothetical protein [Flavihumibacter petaseus]|nr:hypothetical protein [Flavihumibacter petaseus]
MQNQSSVRVSGIILLLLVIINSIIIREAYTGNEKWYLALVVSVPLLMLAMFSNGQQKPVRLYIPFRQTYFQQSKMHIKHTDHEKQGKDSSRCKKTLTAYQ